jgi:hypothetical protein
MDRNEETSIAWSVAQLVVGLGLLGFFLWKLPVVELFFAFTWFVVIPLAILSAAGLVGKSTIDLVLAMPKTFRQRVEGHMEEMRAAA